MLTTVLGEGLTGMQQSQRKMQQAAEDIVRAGVASRGNDQNQGQTGSVPASTAGAATNDLNQSQTVPETDATDRSRLSNADQPDVVGALVEQRRQAHLFDASANVVKVVNDTLGKLIDDLS